MKFFIDTANLEQIKEAQALGVLDGVTTNPSLMAKEGIKGEENIIKHYVDICNAVTGDVSAGTKHISLDMKSVEASNAILDEINAFAASILEDAPIQVGLIDGLNALQVAEDILHIINK